MALGLRCWQNSCSIKHPPPPFPPAKTKVVGKWLAKFLFNHPPTTTFPTRQDNGGGEWCAKLLFNQTTHFHLPHPPRQRWWGNGWQRSYSINPSPPPSPPAKTKVGKWRAELFLNQPPTTICPACQDKRHVEMAGKALIQSTPHHHLFHPPRQRRRGTGWHKSCSINPAPPPFSAVMTKVVGKWLATLLFPPPARLVWSLDFNYCSPTSGRRRPELNLRPSA